jgi:hypothetical protein
MDFAFVPGTTDSEKRMKRMMKTRDPKTTLIDKPGIATVIDFLKELNDQGLKGGDLVLGAHASKRDFALPFDVPFKPQDAARTDYEKLEALDTSGTVHIPSGIRTDDTSVHIKSCRIGETAQPLLVKMKSAFGNPKLITAPKYLHVVADDAGQGIIEYMAYAYEITRPNSTELAKYDDLVAAFKSPPKPFLQGVERKKGQSEVPKTNFDKWIPEQAQLDSIVDKVPMHIPAKLNPPIVRTDPQTHKKFTVTHIIETVFYNVFIETIPWSIDMTGRQVPPDKPGQISLLKSLLLQDRKWKYPPAHEFPYYVRYGFEKFDDFFNGTAWDSNLVVNGSKQTLNYVGTQYIYRVEAPVVKTDTNDLIYNYYPTSGTAIMHFHEVDSVFDMFGAL